jgi:transcriptional regulator with XRE-family HTH domain
MLYILDVMNSVILRAAREKGGWTQVSLAKRLRVTQAYLSLLESGKRRLPPRLAHRLAHLLDLPPTMLPVTKRLMSKDRSTNECFEAQLTRLGYPGFAYRKRLGAVRHPAEVLLAALAFDELEPRLVEALPWLLLHYEGLDLERLVTDAKAQDLQNRLGFTVALARQVAERKREFEKRLTELRHFEGALEPSRLAREETFGQGHARGRLREWLKRERSEAARHWNLLTDLKVEQLPYAR